MKSTSFELSPEEKSQYSECLAIIQKGPRTAEAIGEALWKIQAWELYRGQIGDMSTFFPVCIQMEPEEGFKIIKNWTLTPRGQAATRQHSNKHSGNAVTAKSGALPPRAITKAQPPVPATTPKMSIVKPDTAGNQNAQGGDGGGASNGIQSINKPSTPSPSASAIPGAGTRSVPSKPPAVMAKTHSVPSSAQIQTEKTPPGSPRPITDKAVAALVRPPLRKPASAPAPSTPPTAKRVSTPPVVAEAAQLVYAPNAAVSAPAGTDTTYTKAEVPVSHPKLAALTTCTGKGLVYLDNWTHPDFSRNVLCSLVVDATTSGYAERGYAGRIQGTARVSRTVCSAKSTTAGRSEQEMRRAAAPVLNGPRRAAPRRTWLRPYPRRGWLYFFLISGPLPATHCQPPSRLTQVSVH